MKPTKEDRLQEAAAAALKGVPHVKVQQCMYVSLSSLSASPVRVYVETDFCKLPPYPPEVKTLDQRKAFRADWKKKSQPAASQAIILAMPVLEKAGFRVKLVQDYGWAQLTILGKESL